MSSGVSIAYGDIAVGAKESFIPTASESKFDTYQRNLQTYNMQLYNYANPCELYQTLLDGTPTVFPSNTASAKIGLWSEQLSGDDGVFPEPIALTLESDGQYSSQGFTFTFDKFNDIFPTKMTIQWFRVGEALTEEVEFTPNSGFYFCRNKVDNFDKVVITFYSMNLPQNRLKVEAIDYGYGTVFYGDELRNVNISQSIDPISSEIKINTCDFTLDSQSDMEYSFQSKQSLSVYFNDNLLETVFVKSSRRTARFLWEINSEDYIGLMDSIPYAGGMYKGLSAGTIIRDIFRVAKVPYSVDKRLDDVMIDGYIPYTTCREALMQICFACGAVVTTANSDKVHVGLLDDDIKQTIPLERIMQGQNFEDGDTVTKIELTTHTYSAVEDTTSAYKASESGTGENITVKFSEPLHNLEIVNGEIITAGVNYAVINANDGCVLNGQKYEHTEHIVSKTNPKVLANELENVLRIETATMVSPVNAEAVLDNCYNWLTRVNATNLKIVEGKHETSGGVTYGEATYGTLTYGETSGGVTYDTPVNLGDVITAQTEYLGDVTGRVIEQSFNLNGNILVKETILK